MRRALLVLSVILGLAGPAIPQGAPQEKKLKISEIRGRIVLFDWGGHESDVNEDLIVRVLPDVKGARRYVRVTYQIGVGEIPVSPGDIPQFSAFVGRGRTWIFKVKEPSTEPEKYACGRVSQDIPVEDESGKVMLPRYIATPGAENEPVPPIGTLPCFVLERGGLTPAQTH